MFQNLLTYARRLRLDLAIRARPMAFIGKLYSRLLAGLGPHFTQQYFNANGLAVEKELRWINQWGVEDNLFDLMALYPSLQRVFFIHIPKCGGTSIRQALVDEYGCAPVPLPGTGAIKQSIHYLTNSAPRESLQGQFMRQYASQGKSQELRQQYIRLFTSYCITLPPKHLFILGHKLGRDLKPFYRDSKDLFFTTVRAPTEILRSMVAYRVSHTLRNQNRPDSVELLEATQLDHREFSDLVTSQPRELTERILSVKPPSLVAFLALGNHTDHESVWQGIKEQTIFIAHMSEQSQMLGRLFGKQPNTPPKNTSDNQQTLAAQFSATLENSWVEPFVDSDSSLLYQRLELTGIIGFWRKGGTIHQYRELLENS